jgi:hypothetical protein
MLSPTTRLARTRLASPSKLATFRACPLRYVLETENTGPSPIQAHPATLLGTAVHDTAEAVLGEENPDRVNYVGMVEANFTRLVADRARAGPITSWVMERFGMTGLISRRQLLGQAAFAKSLAERFILGKVGSKGGSKDSPESVPLGSEKWLGSTSLGIGGRVDLIYKEDEGSLRIVDFKTGRVNDEEGKPKAAYLLQLAAYGRIAQELDPSMAVQLELLGKGDAWTGAFDAPLRSLVDTTLQDLHTVLPIGATFSPEDLSRTGDHCAQCSYRPSCESYNVKLDKCMSLDGFDYESSPLDICGEVLEVKTEDALSMIRCKVKNGRTVAISRVPTSLIPEIQDCKGRRIRAYGLGSLEARRQGTFPCNFFIIDLEAPRDSAFQVALVLE